jgi:hypothetical protein
MGFRLYGDDERLVALPVFSSLPQAPAARYISAADGSA